MSFPLQSSFAFKPCSFHILRTMRRPYETTKRFKEHWNYVFCTLYNKCWRWSGWFSISSVSPSIRILISCSTHQDVSGWHISHFTYPVCWHHFMYSHVDCFRSLWWFYSLRNTSQASCMAVIYGSYWCGWKCHSAKQIWRYLTWHYIHYEYWYSSFPQRHHWVSSWTGHWWSVSQRGVLLITLMISRTVHMHFIDDFSLESYGISLHQNVYALIAPIRYCKAPISNMLAFEYNIFPGCMALICILSITIALMFTVKLKKVLRVVSSSRSRSADDQEHELKFQRLILKNNILTIIGMFTSMCPHWVIDSDCICAGCSSVLLGMWIYDDIFTLSISIHMSIYIFSRFCGSCIFGTEQIT